MGTWYWRAADRSDNEERLTTSANRQEAGSVSPDGTMLVYHEFDARGADIWLLPLQKPRQPRAFLATPFAELGPRFSPDGRWLAYQSNISGEFEIWIASVADGSQFPVSKGGDSSHSGHRMAASCSTGVSRRRKAET